MQTLTAHAAPIYVTTFSYECVHYLHARLESLWDSLAALFCIPLFLSDKDDNLIIAIPSNF